MRLDFRYGKRPDSVGSYPDAAAELPPLDELLDEHGVAFGEGAFDCGDHVGNALYFGYSTTASAGIRLYEDGQSEPGGYRIGIHPVAPAQQDFAGKTQTVDF